MKRLDLEVFLLCRPRDLIISSYFDRIVDFSDALQPLSNSFNIEEYLKRNYIKYTLKATDTPTFIYTKQLRSFIYDTIRN
jgi:hypothetical protein